MSLVQGLPACRRVEGVEGEDAAGRVDSCRLSIQAELNWTEAAVNSSDNTLSFHKDHGFLNDWSVAIESTYDLLRILEHCVSDEMDYTPETEASIRELISCMRSAANEEGKLTGASKFS